jgi:hypothetical protein
VTKRPLRRLPRRPHYAGSWPITEWIPLPGRGQAVVYVLLRGGEVRYVGRTEALRQRLGAHGGNGRQFDEWRAYRCRNRADAVELEADAQRRLRPPENADPDAIGLRAVRSARTRALNLASPS